MAKTKINTKTYPACPHCKTRIDKIKRTLIVAVGDYGEEESGVQNVEVFFCRSCAGILKMEPCISGGTPYAQRVTIGQ